MSLNEARWRTLCSGLAYSVNMSAEDANEKMAADWTDKALSEETIVSPGRTESGFLYFRLPAGTTPRGMTLVIKVEELETKTMREFEVLL